MASRFKDRLKKSLKRGIRGSSVASAFKPEQPEQQRPPPVPIAPPGVPPTEPRKPNFTEPEIIRNQDTGEPTFVKMPDGRVVSVVGERPEQVQDLVSSQTKKTALPEGAVEATDVAAQQNNLEKQQEAIAGLGQEVDPSVTLGKDPLAPGLARAGVLGSVGTTTAATIGAAALKGTAGVAALATAPVAGALAAAGGLAIFGAVINDKVKTKKEAAKLFKDSSSRDYLMSLNMANSGFEPSTVMQNYNIMLANMRESERALEEIAKTSIGRDLVGAQVELNTVRLWLADEPNYRLRLAMALQNPNPSIQYQVPQEPNE